MTDLASLLDALKLDPSDDLLRLALADEFEAHGHDARAAFVRAQVEAAATGLTRCPDRMTFLEAEERGVELPADLSIGELQRKETLPCGSCAFCAPMQRAEIIHDRHPWDMLALPDNLPVAHVAGHWSVPVRSYDGSHLLLYLWRGFVARVRCPLSEWQRHGKAIAAAHPVEGGVEVTDLRLASYWERQKVWGWYELAGVTGPFWQEVHKRLARHPVFGWNRYESEDAADADLSRVLIETARGE